MIEFVDVFYKNFLSSGNQGITVQLNRSPSTVVGGKNGAGKSTVFEAISYCLFGQPLKKIVLGGLVNSINAKNMLTTVNFNKLGKSYKVVRGDKPKKLELWVDGQLEDQTASSKDYQTKIEKVLGMDFKLFCQITVLNKERYVPFMEMKSADRRKVVEDILDINVLSIMSDLLKEDAKTVTATISDFKYQRSKIEEKISGQNRLIAEAESNVDERRKEVQNQIVKLEEQLVFIDENVSALIGEIEIAGDPKTKLDKASARKSEFEKIANTFQTKIRGLNEIVNFLTINDHCPTCKQEIDEAFKEKSKNESATEIDKIKTNSLMLAEEYQKAVDTNKELHKAVETLRDLNMDLRRANDEKANITRKINETNTFLLSLVANPKLDQYKQEKEELGAKFDELSKQLDGSISEEELNSLIKNYLKDDGVKSSIVKDYIGFINIRLNEYLNSMNFLLNITLNENFDEKINSINRENFTVDNLSTGQKCRVNLSVWMALLEVSSLKNSAVTNLICLDEVLENLDANGVEDFMKLVKEKLPHKNLFVITQRFDEFKGHFYSNVEFQLVDGFTEFVK